MWLDSCYTITPLCILLFNVSPLLKQYMHGLVLSLIPKCKFPIVICIIMMYVLIAVLIKFLTDLIIFLNFRPTTQVKIWDQRVQET